MSSPVCLSLTSTALPRTPRSCCPCRRRRRDTRWVRTGHTSSAASSCPPLGTSGLSWGRSIHSNWTIRDHRRHRPRRCDRPRPRRCEMSGLLTWVRPTATGRTATCPGGRYYHCRSGWRSSPRTRRSQGDVHKFHLAHRCRLKLKDNWK